MEDDFSVYVIEGLHAIAGSIESMGQNVAWLNLGVLGLALLMAYVLGRLGSKK